MVMTVDEAVVMASWRGEIQQLLYNLAMSTKRVRICWHQACPLQKRRRCSGRQLAHTVRSTYSERETCRFPLGGEFSQPSRYLRPSDLLHLAQEPRSSLCPIGG